MSYQVLARRWRPRTFHELVGQEHVVRALTNALDHDRLHHAFLFTGTRGVGKTTISRIFAKSLNCERGVSSNPCGECGACREVDEGRFVDLIEVDAASRTKVEDTRELLENVQYAPTRGRYKVYLIDEVHMLSAHSFNALLKTLEEPPPHVKFLLATTDPQKLPVTILSRCLQFNLKRLPTGLIAQHLAHILEREGIACDAAALELLARAGEGSMRDALSLLDQAIAFGGGRVSLEAVSAMLGSLDPRQVLGLIEALASGDAAVLMEQVMELERAAADFEGVLAELITRLQRIALLQALPETAGADWPEREALCALAARLAPEEVQLWYQIALHGRRDLPLSPEARGGFEMVLLRMLCFRPLEEAEAPVRMPTTSQAAPAATPRQPPSAGVRAVLAGNGTAAAPAHRPAPTRADPAPTVAQSAASAHPLRPEPDVLPAPSRQPAPPVPLAEAPLPLDWQQAVRRLELKGVALQLALNCQLEARQGNTLRLLLEPSHVHMRTPNAERQLLQALERYLGTSSLRLEFRAAQGELDTPARQQAQRLAERRQAAIESIEQDPNVRALCDTFDAQIRTESITPLDS
ncbi:MAG TPA: DNA polymerase III subunit gamma/tau [Candidatus Competibacteraceae bacterium]|nr:DNA polymerase III subunit gamma/tau [Candidatus Competibacteraceae bacterium]